MSTSPASLRAAASFWTKRGGVNLGIVGDLDHQKRASYHNGKDVIVKYGRTSANDYSIRTVRDKAGLTNAASAIDLGRLNGSLTQLWAFSRWFAQQCMDKKPGYRDVREIIFWSPIRNRVIGWSALRPTEWINDYGDLSHKTHTHISFYRDSEARDKTMLFAAYPEFAVAPLPPVEDEMKLSQNLPGYTATVKKSANIRTGPALNATILRAVDVPENWVLTGAVTGQVDPEGGSDQWYVRWVGTKWEYTAASNLIAPPLAPASQVELAAAKARAAQALTALDVEQRKVADAKAVLNR